MELALDCVKLTKAIQHNPFTSLHYILPDLLPIDSLLIVLWLFQMKHTFKNRISILEKTQNICFLGLIYYSLNNRLRFYQSTSEFPE